MTTKTSLEIECRANRPEDKLFLALCCGHKKITTKQIETDNQTLSLKWADIQIMGPAAACLYLEAIIPTPSLFPNGNMGMPLALLHWWQSMIKLPAGNEAVLIANSLLISRQMKDGRPFLQGPSPGLADISAASWCIPHQHLFENDTSLSLWIERMQTLTSGRPPQSPVKLTPLTDIRKNAQHQGLLYFTVEGDITTITSPLDDTPGPMLSSS